MTRHEHGRAGTAPCPRAHAASVAVARLSRRRLVRFARGQDGGLVVFALFIFIAMLAIGGMAYDLMRYEQVRARLQGVADSATLAAANLNNAQDADTVVRDYFAKAGMEGTLGGLLAGLEEAELTAAYGEGASQLTDGVLVEETVTSRRVTAAASATLNTAFMRMTGIDTLDLHVVSTARQEAGDIEIALVLDVSGSMGGTREQRMRSAATQFIDTILPEGDIPAEERPTVSIVPYNDMVNLGAAAAPYFGLENTHDYSHCARLPATGYDTTALDLSGGIERIGHFDRWTESTAMPIPRPQCPTGSFNSILLHSADPDALKTHIAALRADTNGWTAIGLGTRFGAALLDPSLRPVTDAMVADGLLGARASGLPKAFIDDSGAVNKKALVLMTDGDNTRQYDLKPEFKTGMSNVYYAPGYQGYYNNGVSAAFAVYIPERAETGAAWWFPYYAHYYAENPFETWGQSYSQLSNTELFHRASVEHIGHEIYGYGVPGYERYIYYSGGYPQSRAHEIYATDTTLDTQTRAICDAAKAAGMTIYTVAFSAPSGGRALMEYCASSPSHYFDVDEDDIVLAFEAIGRNINQLRLTQ